MEAIQMVDLKKQYRKIKDEVDTAVLDVMASAAFINGKPVQLFAENLAKYYLLYGDINLINAEVELFHSITREEIRDVAKKYLNPNQRLILDYVPVKEKAQN